ncbi:flagellar hook-associated protein 2 [Anaerosporobacter mobilis DSM 15930]|uniref:Flagellar hook-associated protein 2 n=1 Tax=Anaerosporobacter mobilis DSM 15930 TaxID=1120996 RepID=A0A1M7LQX6_9FIRM|nr:flagellar filament capping protein FliD [Anaerosporobacter mobilis]SHM80084.1 flagellar hook-associated protein 2 [Anaerosporobacter mobilis DSM 15930]
MAGIRMTGMISNMDTESIVESMMDAHRLKLTKIENNKTKLEWKQDKWKELNTKLYKLYQEQTSKLRLTSNYKSKKVTSSNESVVKVTSDKNATEGTHSFTVKELASSQYVTGAKLGSDVKETTKLADLGFLSGTTINISAANGKKNTSLTVSSSTTLGDFIKSCGKVGLNASYDAKQQRLFIGSASSGTDQTFSITSDVSNTIIGGIGDADQAAAKTAMETIYSNKNAISGMTDVEKTAFYEAAAGIDLSKTDDELKAANGWNDTQVTYAKAYKNLYDMTASNNESTNRQLANTEAEKIIQEAIKQAIYSDTSAGTATITDKGNATYTISGIASISSINADASVEADKTIAEYMDGTLASTQPALAAALDEYKEAAKAKMQLENPDIDFNDPDVIDQLNNNIKDRYQSDLVEEKVNAEVTRVLGSTEGIAAYTGYSDSVVNKSFTTANKNLISNIQGVINSGGAGLAGSTTSVLDSLGIGNITTSVGADGKITTKSTNTNCVTVSAADCKVVYNGADLTSSSNSLTVNGLTFEAVSVSEQDGSGNYKPTSITVTKDSKGMYDMVKKFLTEYNSILKDMNTLYYADSARGYNPLTDEEKEAMTDDQIKLWEDKIKDSSLRRDTTLGGITSAMKQAISTTVEVDGKKYSLSSFGIMTSRDYTEKGLLHIYGDKDDATYSDKDDKLMKAIEEDPDLVAKVMAGITDNLHSTLMNKMSKTSLSSALTFYNDKQIDKQISQYKKDISTMESKLKDKEAAYYKQFTAMEKALAAMQSQQSALSGLLGSN